MNTKVKMILVAGALALSACTNPAGLGGGGVTDGTAGAGTGGVIPGSVSDPTSVAYFQQAVGDRVLFVVDQSTLTDQGRAILDGQAQWLITNTDYTAVIEGHADE
ncbi:MAG: peptidoglycan-associated lipoprotein, partial [Ascidiaceihabitans sp.]